MTNDEGMTKREVRTPQHRSGLHLVRDRPRHLAPRRVTLTNNQFFAVRAQVAAHPVECFHQRFQLPHAPELERLVPLALRDPSGERRQPFHRLRNLRGPEGPEHHGERDA